MLPPAPKPKQALKNKQVMEEDDFVAALERIIGRDFFPDLPKLREQLDWLDGVSPKDAALARRIIMSEQRGWGALGAGAGSSASEQAADDGHDAPELDSAQDSGLSLSAFVAAHTSEDNESFQQLLHKMQEAHRSSYWWVYEGAAAPHLILADGTRLDKETAAAMEVAAAAKPRIGDGRSGMAELWPYRSRNQLMFPPQLAESCEISRVSGETTAALMLENSLGSDDLQPARSTALALIKSGSRVGAAVRAPRVIQHSATRLQHVHDRAAGHLQATSGSAPSPFEVPDSERSSVAGLNALDGRQAADAKRSDLQELVPMTPVYEPGAGGDEPVMTWGQIQVRQLEGIHKRSVR